MGTITIANEKLTRSGAPRRLCCFVLEYKSYVCLHTAPDIYQLDGHVPEMDVLGETADISLFSEFSFWVWVKFREDGGTFPDDKMVLGKYLGPSIDVRPAMMQQAAPGEGSIPCFCELSMGPEDHGQGSGRRYPQSCP